MASLAFYAGMFAGQLEGSQLVIESPVIPGAGVMAGGALFPKTALVEIILLVAGKTGCGRTHEKIVGVTLPAGYSHVRPDQFETSQVVVILRRAPSLRGMAGGTIRAQFSLMGIVGLMAGKAGLGRQFQVSDFARTHMALRAQRNAVPTCQRKGEQVMVEIVPVRIQPVVAVQALHTERNSMIAHERLIRFFMTIPADGYIERGDVLPVAVAAQKGLILRLGLVTV